MFSHLCVILFTGTGLHPEGSVFRGDCIQGSASRAVGQTPPRQSDTMDTSWWLVYYTTGQYISDCNYFFLWMYVWMILTLVPLWLQYVGIVSFVKKIWECKTRRCGWCTTCGYQLFFCQKKPKKQKKLNVKAFLLSLFHITTVILDSSRIIIKYGDWFRIPCRGVNTASSVNHLLYNGLYLKKGNEMHHHSQSEWFWFVFARTQSKERCRFYSVKTLTFMSWTKYALQELQ